MAKISQKGSRSSDENRTALHLEERLQSLAEKGDAEAQYRLGQSYYYGKKGVPINYKEAIKWYRKSAIQGYFEAKYSLELCYKNRLGVPDDYQEAIRFFKEAAEQGDVLGQIELGKLYLKGNSSQNDYVEAEICFSKAANQGYADAQFELGKLHLKGLGVQQSYSKAFFWFLKAAKHGCPEAQFELAKLYLMGKGVSSDNKLAEKWFRIAADNGFKKAKSFLKIIEREKKEAEEVDEIKMIVIRASNDMFDCDSTSSSCFTYEPNVFKNSVELADASQSKIVYCSTFAPAEVKRSYRMLVQVYLHLFEDTERVIELARESQKNAKRRDYCPLNCKLKIGDKIDVVMSFYGEKMLKSERKSVVWQGSFTKCSFDYLVPSNIKEDELFCTATLTVNEAPVGEMSFFTKIVKSPRKLNPEVFSRKFRKVFISYSHNDEKKVKFLAEAFKIQEINCFFDREYLKPGVVFPQEIQDYIKSADLFVLCWSKNASKSEYVEKERLMALKRAFPQVVPKRAAKLSIYPISIGAQVELPSDMKDIYHFGIIG